MFRQHLLFLSLMLVLPACTMCDGNAGRSRDPNHHLEVSRGAVSYNGTPLSWTAPVSTWVATLGPPSAERVSPAADGKPSSLEHTETTWSDLGMSVTASSGLPRRLYIRTSGAAIHGEPSIDVLLAPGEDGQPTLGVFPGSVIIEGAQIVDGDTVPQLAAAFRARCHPEFTVARRGLFGWEQGGDCLALDYDTGYYFYNGRNDATERIDYVVGVEITHYAHDELESQRRSASWSRPADP